MANATRQLLLTCTTLAALAPPLAAVRAAGDVPYVPTSEPVVAEMLRLANIGAKDTLYDLGSGDGRIVITAAKELGARGVGVDIDPQRIAESRDNAQRAGVTGRVKFIEGDLFKVDLHPATAVTLYLLPAVNLRLRPKLLDELRPGTPVVSHDFDMGDWPPEKKVSVGRSTVYLWHIPARVAGSWEYRFIGTNGREEQHRLDLEQNVQDVSGTVTIDGLSFPIQSGTVTSDHITFTVNRPVHGVIEAQQFDGQITENGIVAVTATIGNSVAHSGPVAKKEG